MGRRGYSLHLVFLLTIVIGFSLVYQNNIAEGFNYNPIPAVKVKSVPTIQDFETKDRTELLGNLEHAVIIRENGEAVDIYLLYTSGSSTKPVIIFYFEDSTDEKLKNYYPFNSDYLSLYFTTMESAEDERFIFSERHSVILSIINKPKAKLYSLIIP